MNGILTRTTNVSQVRLDTQLFSGWGRKSDCSIMIKDDTNICEVKNQPDKCVVFLPTEHIIINESYSEMKKLIRNLK